MKVTQWMPWHRNGQTLPVRFNNSSLFGPMPGLFDDLLMALDTPPLASAAELRPQADLAETDEEYRIEVELPGIAEDDIEVSLTEDVLTISGTKRTESEEKRDDYHHVERTFGSFRRAFQLPQKVDEEKIEATFNKGLLTVRLPKVAEAAEATHRIAVTSAS